MRFGNKYFRLWAAYLLAAVLLLSGCGSDESEDGIAVYYKELTFTGLRTERAVITGESQDEMVYELWLRLCRSDYDEERISVVPAGMELTRFSVDRNNLSLYLNSVYLDMDNVSELLFRAAAVKTFTQLAGIETVSFFVDEKPLMNSSYTPLGAQRASDYADIVGSALPGEKRTTLTLYFASGDGESLVRDRREAVYVSAYSVEKDVIRRLIAGPQAKGHEPTLPEDLQLISINVKDRICYVNFDSTFIRDALPLDSQLIIYSIVNSLTELPEVYEVQIMIEGDSDVEFRGISLDHPFERNLNLISGAE